MHVESIAMAKADRNHATGLRPMHDARAPLRSRGPLHVRPPTGMTAF